MAIIRNLPIILLFSYILLHAFYYYRDTMGGRQRSGPRPWEESPDWAENRIISLRHKRLWFHLYGTIILNFFSFFALLALIDGVPTPSYAIFAVVLVIAGAISLTVTTYRAIQWLKFGRLVLVMDPFPGRLGLSLRGTIELPKLVEKRGSFSVTLKCVHLTRRWRSNTMDREVVWQETIQAYPVQGRSSEQLTFQFQGVPADLYESTLYHSHFGYDWIVNIRADLPGVDLNRDFVIPVYKVDREFRRG